MRSVLARCRPAKRKALGESLTRAWTLEWPEASTSSSRAAPSSTRTARACATSASRAAGSRRIGDLSRAVGRRDRRLPRPAHPARRDRHPGAFPRARASPTRRTWRPARAAPCMGGVTAVFEMPNTNPTTTSAEALADKVARGASPHALRLRLLRRRHARERQGPAELERLPGCAGVKVFMGSSTGSLLVEDDEGVRDILKAIRRRAAFHSEDEYRLQRAQEPARRGRSALASGLARRGRGAALHAAPRAARARDRQARPRAAHLDRAGDGLPRRTTRTSPRSR